MWHRRLQLHKGFEIHFLTSDYTWVWHCIAFSQSKAHLDSEVCSLLLFYFAAGSEVCNWNARIMWFLNTDNFMLHGGATFSQLKIARLAWVLSQSTQRGIFFCSLSGTARHYCLGTEGCPCLYIESWMPDIASVLQLRMQVTPKNKLGPSLQPSTSLAVAQQVIFFSLFCLFSFVFFFSLLVPILKIPSSIDIHWVSSADFLGCLSEV